MKKLFSVLLIVAIMTAFAVSAFAADMSLSASDVTAKKGDTITIPVSVVNNPGIGALDAELVYDSSALKLTGAEAGSTFGATVNSSNGTVAFAKLEGVSDDGVLVTYTFEVIGDSNTTVKIEASGIYTPDMAELPDCSVSVTVTVESDKPAHTHTLVKTDEVAATCSAEGTKAYWTCSECGKLFSDAEGKTEIAAPEKIDKIPHTWGEWTVTKAATCTEDGEESRTCSVCGETESNVIEKIPHNWGEWTVTKEATCTEEGSRTRTCSVGGETETEVIATIPHTWGEWTETKAATCTEAGEETRTCSVCGEKETRATAVIPHTLTKTDEVAATCSAEGTKAYWTCSVCGKLFSDAEGKTEITAPEKIAKIDHVPGEWTVKTAATCTEKGVEETTCTVCGETLTREVDALGHKWGEWTITKEATATTAGEEERTCSVCGVKETHETDPTGSQKQSDAKTSPKTGDETVIAPYIVILAVCAMGTAVVITKKVRG